MSLYDRVFLMEAGPKKLGRREGAALRAINLFRLRSTPAYSPTEPQSAVGVEMDPLLKRKKKATAQEIWRERSSWRRKLRGAEIRTPGEAKALAAKETMSELEARRRRERG